MTRTFYKSLDRPVNIFGLRGAWVRIYLILLGCSLVLALMLGALLGSAAGFAVFIVSLIGLFFSCLVIQQRLPARQIGKARIQSRMTQAVIRRETLSRILLDPPGAGDR